MKLTPDEKRRRKARYQRQWQATNKPAITPTEERIRRRDATRRYRLKLRGIKPKQCEICGDDKDRIEFDHCHQRGIFRGWICGHCNRALGHAKDDPTRLRKMIAYLERTKGDIPDQLTLPGL